MVEGFSRGLFVVAEPDAILNRGAVTSFGFVCPVGQAYFCATKVEKTWGNFDSPSYPHKTTQELRPWTPSHRKTVYITRLWEASSDSMTG